MLTVWAAVASVFKTVMGVICYSHASKDSIKRNHKLTTSHKPT